MKMVYKDAKYEIWHVIDSCGREQWCVYGLTQSGDPLWYPSKNMVRDAVACGFS